jgi:predicted dehydrogenase
MKKSPCSRRHFLRGAATSVAVIGFPTIIPGTALGKGRPAPSNRVNMATIGYGTIAFSTTGNFLSDDRVQMVAVADPAEDLPGYNYDGGSRGGRLVGKKRIEEYYAGQAASGAYKGCKAYEDFRELFEREDIDAVQVCTPDHWHALVAIQAARKGLHIYGQKPLALTIGEGRRMVEEITKAGVTFQTGSQQRSDQKFRMAVEFIRNKRLGKLEVIKVGLPAGHTDWNKHAGEKGPAVVPAGLNWDLWLGPAAMRDYTPAISPLNWRHNFDYSGGMITDWGAHHLDIVQWALDQDLSGPARIDILKAERPPLTELFNTPTAYEFNAVYADGTTVNVSGAHRNGIEFIGEGGRKIFVTRGTIESTPADLLREKIREDEVRVYESKMHERNFIDCVYSGKPAIAPVETGHRTISIAHLANIAIRTDSKTIQWDPAAEKISGNTAASALLQHPWRNPYGV